MIHVPSGHAIVPVTQIVDGLEKAYNEGYHKGVVVGATVALVSVVVARRIRKRALRNAQIRLRTVRKES